MTNEPTPAAAIADATRSAQAAALMHDFAVRTGIVGARPPRRYLWTDAFAVCNFLALGRADGDATPRALALRLIDQVHHTLGKRRPDDGAPGWLSGLRGEQAEEHPTRGGLRIGKPLPERAPHQPPDARREWERDGQYFHYLTPWMHALDRAARATRSPQLNRWGRELAETAYHRFVHGHTGRPRIYWKMSVDLGRPLVASMGQHDALDGFIACAELRATAARLWPGKTVLATELQGFADMIEPAQLPTADPLGLGTLLVDADRLDRLPRAPASPLAAPQLRDTVLMAARVGLSRFVAAQELQRPLEQRLAFRELGLAIGLQAAARMRLRQASAVVLALQRFEPLAAQIIDCWRRPEARLSAPLAAHRDIDDVMLATALVPGGLLGDDEE